MLGKILTGKLDGMPHRQIPNTYPNAADVDTDYEFTTVASAYPVQMGAAAGDLLKLTTNPTYVDVANIGSGNGPFVWAGMKFGTVAAHAANFILINDVPVSVDFLEGLAFDLTRTIESDMIGGSGYDQGAVTGNEFMVRGSGLNLLFRNTTFVLATLKKAKIALNMLFKGLQIGTTGQFYSMETHVPKARLTDTGLLIESKKMVTGGALVAELDKTVGYSIKITTTDTFDMTNLGGAAGATCGWAPM